MEETLPKITQVEMIDVKVSKREWNVIQLLRQIQYGSMTIQKQSGVIIMVEPAPTIKIDDKMDILLPFGV